MIAHGEFTLHLIVLGFYLPFRGFKAAWRSAGGVAEHWRRTAFWPTTEPVRKEVSALLGVGKLTDLVGTQVGFVLGSGAPRI